MQKRDRVRVAERPPIVTLPQLVTDENAHFKIGPDGKPYAGDHLIFDFWGASHLADAEYVEQTLRAAVEASGATLLHMHLHQFPEGGAGVSGVAVLAESHISIHTWPERGLATLDIFMCGKTDPEKGFKVLRAAFAPTGIVKALHRRGQNV